MRFIVDLHIHSRFARACSKEITVANLDQWARRKGVQILGTGDCLHPQWLRELKEELKPAEQGLYVYKGAGSREQGTTRFILTTEVACIYKHRDKARRVHHVLHFPSFEAVDRYVARLEQRGCNLRSDGRPIVGLSSQELLRMTTDVGGLLVPAHAWTPWFAVFGSKSGYDSLEECFEELTGEIIAIETGLSSDPPMNWRVSSLDRVALVSNSDAHSLPNIGREANVLELTALSYTQCVEAIRNGAPARRQVMGGDSLPCLSHLHSTIEFYPEEGMYHYDGHRLCGVRWDPKETRRRGGRCTACGLPVTVGVMNRVQSLADRDESPSTMAAPSYHHLVELDKIIAEAMDIQSRFSKRVKEEYDRMVEFGGSELAILLDIPLATIGSFTTIPMIVEGIKRVREERLTVIPGYDGTYGEIHIFKPEEVEKPQRTLL